jgi:tetrahydromethanopterin S-methyltransferase subunit H
MPETKTEELECIKESGLKSAILLILNSRNPTIQGRIEVLDECLNMAEKAGIENCLVDATILDIPDPGPVGKTIFRIKEKYGLPAGCGAHNAVDQWHHRRKLDPSTYLASGVVANVVPITMGADFLLYGPIKNSRKAYIPCAVADAYVAYAVGQEYGIRPIEKTHPLYRVFREIGSR